jgi:molybdopterin/thiamine biosynthesis adenylyltransferase
VKPRIIITEDVLQKLTHDPESVKDLYGIPRLSENIIHIQSLHAEDGLKSVGYCRSGMVEIDDLNVSIPLSEVGAIPLFSEFTSRSQGIIDTSALTKKKVALVGEGSVGSQMTLHLAQSGVESFSILDPDTLSASNLSRHACDLNDLGRYKTLAVRDMILRRNPRAKIQTFEEDFLSLDWEDQISRFEGSSLVIASTDSTAVQFTVNEVCYSLGIPSLYVGCYERACAGEILFVIPGKTPCFYCFMEFRQSQLEGVKRKEKKIPYSDEDPSSFKGEPGLAIDISYIVSVASAHALALLLPDSERGGLLDPERNLILLHSGSLPKGKYREIFKMPFDLLLARVRRDEECLVCQNESSVKGG